MQGDFAPYQQKDVIEFIEEHSRQVAARAIISEGVEGISSILLESPSRSRIAILDTSHAVARREDDPPSNRYITVHRASLGELSGMELMCIAQADRNREGVILWRGSVVGEAMLLAVRVLGDGHVTVVVDVGGKLLATLEQREHERGARPLWLLHIAGSVDAALVMVATIASHKLR